MSPITEFQGDYRFLSNFCPVEILYEGNIYPSVEHAYQAAKTLEPLGRSMIQRAATPGQAKKLGKCLVLRSDWEQIKLQVMSELIVQKFKHPWLKKKLLATEGAELIEGNNWGDHYWGICKGYGENNLGKLLMMMRNHLIENSFHENLS